jgi:protein SCO1
MGLLRLNITLKQDRFFTITEESAPLEISINKQPFYLPQHLRKNVSAHSRIKGISSRRSRKSFCFNDLVSEENGQDPKKCQDQYIREVLNMIKSPLLIQSFFGSVILCFISIIAAEAHTAMKGHEMHEAMMQTAPYQKSIHEYQIPEVTLYNQNSQNVAVKEYFDSPKPIVLNFIFSTCSTICPVLSATFSDFQKRMGPEHGDIQLVSVSIDPDNDTPQVLKEYLIRYGAQDSWDILTGKRENVIQVLKGFDAYVANKMDHFPLTLMRAPGSNKWVRLEGLLSAADLQKEYEQMMTH